eukprot:Amastigsp_a521127_50.p1 type:complete len:352 gc:universal Amastigsp_a521127_50:1087-32(-)
MRRSRLSALVAFVALYGLLSLTWVLPQPLRFFRFGMPSRNVSLVEALEQRGLVLQSDSRPWNLTQFHTLSSISVSAYAERHGYDYMFAALDCQVRNETTGTCCRHNRQGVDRSAHWCKLLVLFEQLKRYPWVLFVDTDAAVAAPNMSLADAVQRWPIVERSFKARLRGEFDVRSSAALPSFVFSDNLPRGAVWDHDEGAGTPCSGIFIAFAGAATVELLQIWWSVTGTPTFGSYEQDALMQFYYFHTDRMLLWQTPTFYRPRNWTGIDEETRRAYEFERARLFLHVGHFESRMRLPLLKSIVDRDVPDAETRDWASLTRRWRPFNCTRGALLIEDFVRTDNSRRDLPPRSV